MIVHLYLHSNIIIREFRLLSSTFKNVSRFPIWPSTWQILNLSYAQDNMFVDYQISYISYISYDLSYIHPCLCCLLFKVLIMRSLFILNSPIDQITYTYISLSRPWLVSLYLGLLFLYSNSYFLIEANFVKKSTHLEIRKLEIGYHQ